MYESMRNYILIVPKHSHKSILGDSYYRYCIEIQSLRRVTKRILVSMASPLGKIVGTKYMIVPMKENYIF